jgi:hypothetical protein
MSEIDRHLDRAAARSAGQRWSSWDSPVGLGLFFVLIAAAIDLARLAFK